MSPLTRQLSAAAIAAAVACAGAAPALASSRPASSDSVTARTPLTTMIASKTSQLQVNCFISDNDVDDALYANFLAVNDAANEAEHLGANPAQTRAKLEWILGARLQGHADNTVLYGETEDVYRHPQTGASQIRAGLSAYRLGDYYLRQADSTLGIRHRFWSAQIYRSDHHREAPVGPGAVTTPVGLDATIEMDTPVLHEALPADIETAGVALNEAAANYDLFTVSRMHVDPAERSGQRAWLEGVQTQLRADELLNRGIQTHAGADPAAGNAEMKASLSVFRAADAQLARADARLGIRSSGPSATLPSHVIYYRG